MKRQIITIDEDTCNGCGQCITGCPEGALQLIDGKARLVGDLYCDGLGACIGTCPEGAITVIEREAEPYDERRVMEGIILQGDSVIAAHLAHLKEHGEIGYYNEAAAFLRERGMTVPEQRHAAMECGCPGSMARTVTVKERSKEGPAGEIGSELRQWPVQLALLNPAALYFDDADLLVAADCTAFSFGEFHRTLLRGKILVVFCPKLDQSMDRYVEKLAAIFSGHRIRSITTVRMEVPCCGGVNMIVRKAMEQAGIALPVEELVIGMDGRIIGGRRDETVWPKEMAEASVIASPGQRPGRGNPS